MAAGNPVRTPALAHRRSCARARRPRPASRGRARPRSRSPRDSGPERHHHRVLLAARSAARGARPAARGSRRCRRKRAARAARTSPRRTAARRSAGAPKRRRGRARRSIRQGIPKPTPAIVAVEHASRTSSTSAATFRAAPGGPVRRSRARAMAHRKLRSTAAATALVPPRSTPMTHSARHLRHYRRRPHGRRTRPRAAAPTSATGPRAAATPTRARRPRSAGARSGVARRTRGAGAGTARAKSPSRRRLRGCRAQAPTRATPAARGGCGAYAGSARSLAAWIGVSLVLFVISSLTATGVPAPPSPRCTGGGLPPFSATTILVLGSDAPPARLEGARRGERQRERPDRSDTMMLIRTGGGSTSRLSIPRDMLVDLPGYGLQKINAAYYFGGAALAIRTVESFLGIKINHVILINFTNFPNLVNAMGGVDLDRQLRRLPDQRRLPRRRLFARPAGGHPPPQRRSGARPCPHAREQLQPRVRPTSRASCSQQKLLAAMKGQVLSPTGFIRLPWIAWARRKRWRPTWARERSRGSPRRWSYSAPARRSCLYPTGAELSTARTA